MNTISALFGGLLRVSVGIGCFSLGLEYSYYALGFSDMFKSLSIFGGNYCYVGDMALWFFASALLLWDGVMKLKESMA